MMTSEKLDSSVASSPTNIISRIKKSTPLQLRPRQTRRCKREAAPVTAEDYEDSARYLRKRNRKENDYGALSTLGSELLKLDLIESETQNHEVCTKHKDNYHAKCFSQNSATSAVPANCYRIV